VGHTRPSKALRASGELTFVSSFSVGQPVTRHVRRVASSKVTSWPGALEWFFASVGAGVCFQLAAICE
jgi:hypothetical protein